MDTIKNFLLKIDGFLLKYWKLPTFIYFVGALWFCLEKGIITDDFIRIEMNGIHTSPITNANTNNCNYLRKRWKVSQDV